VGVDKRKYMQLVFTAEELSALGRIRDVFDPQGKCNPGKVLPDGASGNPGMEKAMEEGSP